MALREILIYPDSKLRIKAEPVAEVSADIRRLVDDMSETMYSAPGIGLAANQVGELVRVVVIDVDHPEGEPNLLVLINPEIVESDGEIVWEEGCLSFPDIREDIKRAGQVTVRALDREGKPHQVKGEGLLAVALQHEIDHLDGVTMIDRVSYLKRRMIHRQLTKQKKTA